MAKAKVSRVNKNARVMLKDGPLAKAVIQLSAGCARTLTFTCKGQRGWYDPSGYFHTEPR